jgi:hypothetical protein
MPREVFIAGQILTAAEMNTVSDQTVMVFAGTAARGSAIPSPSEGMVTYLSDVNQVQAYTGSAFTAVGTILQVVSETRTTTFSESVATTQTTTTSPVSVTITPSSSSSKVFVMVSLPIGLSNTGNAVHVELLRNGSPVFVGTSASSRRTATMGVGDITGVSVETATMQVLDTPSSTSAQTYTVRMSHSVSITSTIYVNRSHTDTDQLEFGRYVATISAMEIAG